jgi:hypothetical protein
LQLLQDPWSEQRQVGRKIVADDFMGSAAIRVSAALDYAIGEGFDACHVVDGIIEAEIVIDEDLADHGTRDHSHALSHDIQFEDWTIFFFTSLEEHIGIAKVFSIMSRITFAQGDRWDWLWEEGGPK